MKRFDSSVDTLANVAHIVSVTPRRFLTVALLSVCIAQLQLAQNSTDSTEPGLKLEFIKIKPGEFQMGCPAEEKKCAGQPPAHPVRIEREFEAAKFQVTLDQWKLVMGERPSYKASYVFTSRALVSWDDTQLFIQKMNEKNDGYYYRLPTDAEWEYMARAGTADEPTRFSDSYDYGQTARGDFILLGTLQDHHSDDLECSLDSARSTASIEYRCVREDKQKPSCGDNIGQIKCPTIPPRYFRNRWGLYDMSGETPEWIEDWPKSDYGLRLVRGEVKTFSLGPPRSPVVLDAEVSSKKWIPRQVSGFFGFRCVRERRN